MSGWVGDGLSKIIAGIALIAILVLVLQLFFNTGDSGLPKAFVDYFAGVFSRG